MSRTALVVIDMINPYAFSDAEKLIPSAERTVPVIEGLIDRASGDVMPVIYVNDNFGHSALEEIGSLIPTGQVTEQCILYSALDGYISHFGVRVPPDAVAHIHEDVAEAALRMMERNMDADLTPARD